MAPTSGDGADRLDDLPAAENVKGGRADRVLLAWLSALADDAEAAVGAAFAYAALPPDGRGAWLDALAGLAPSVEPVAVFAPLLAVEEDAPLRARLVGLLTDAGAVFPKEKGPARAALRGRAPSGEEVLVLVFPLYLNFGEALACGLRGADLVWAKHEPLDLFAKLAAKRTAFGAQLSPASVLDVTDALAHAVVAAERAGKPLDDTLRAFSHAFGV